MNDFLEKSDVTPEQRLVLNAIASALSGRSITPDLMRTLAPQYFDAVPGHTVRIEHVPKRISNTKLRLKAIYKITIVGSRLDTEWRMSPNLLESLLKTVGVR